MCGIAGLLDPTGSSTGDELAAIASAMAGEVAHRGPDGHGTWVDPAAGVGLGHRRLSILDLSDAGAQPMTSADGRWVLAYNGEVYNHRELGRRLVAEGVRLRGHSDTEVLVEAIAAWGLGRALERCEGMWAFAVWDRRERRLTLARDRVGEKPLYYGTAGRAVVFASGLDALAAHPDFDRTISADAVCGLMRYKYVPAPLAIFRDACKLPPGCTVVVEADGSVGEPVAYWSYAEVVEQAAARPFEGSITEAVDELEQLLASSVSRRLVADVPVGAFLSGGIDSSTIVAAMQAVASGPVATFTIGSPDSGFDESDDARRVARHLGTRHHELIATGADALAVVDLLPVVYDEPFADSSQIPTFLVSQLARRHVTVALSGDGGDELFGGYNRYRWIPGIDRRLRRVPIGARRLAARIANRLPADRWDDVGRVIPERVRPRQLGLKVEKAASVAVLGGPEEMYLRVISHWPDPTAVVPRGTDPEVLAKRPERWPAVADGTARMMAVDLLTYLPDDILTKVDRATMAVGLEGRVPFLDRRIVEFAAALPMSMRSSDGESKVVLRRLLDRSVPRHLVDRTKTGFGIPLDAWLRGPLRGWASDLLDGPVASEWFDPTTLRTAWDEHRTGARNHGYRLWDVLMFLAWAEHRGLS
ncbi:asparagine synthase (glutamine-hydrolyzing) [Dermatobacter hominis]|uniref:asparagine synthase (glutamine-hydrolyzing) n=1 Tax=Dermatobacter hominis TaxID=2884263 RepID=UPI001D122FFA|nr:asparagine synthase (glutamine-hydrolyzing) [Dermatobacter hominis]UDY33929.1 asparagine synthase (glutamine-hydrolyzing) [Dermatobacter hominis]